MDDFENQLPEDTGEELARLARETLESQSGTSDSAAMRIRCQRVIDLYASGSIEDSRDNFHAALVLLYGEQSAHYELARSFAQRAAQQGESRAWSVSAMAWDRWLLSLGKPQRFGTQIIKKGGRWSLGELDPTINDIDRAMFGVPPLYVQEQRARQLQSQEESGDEETGL
jgi:hypothetical protein